MSGKTDKPEEASFEQAMARLGEIVGKLEDGDLPLEESLTLFEEGVKLSKLTQKKLDQAQHKVEQLLGIGEDGRAKTTPFATNDDEDR
jgi:exodeoxyribonuclease VII small subunit